MAFNSKTDRTAGHAWLPGTPGSGTARVRDAAERRSREWRLREEAKRRKANQGPTARGVMGLSVILTVFMRPEPATASCLPATTSRDCPHASHINMPKHFGRVFVHRSRLGEPETLPRRHAGSASLSALTIRNLTGRYFPPYYQKRYSCCWSAYRGYRYHRRQWRSYRSRSCP